MSVQLTAPYTPPNVRLNVALVYSYACALGNTDVTLAAKWSGSTSVRVGILTLFAFCTVSIAVFVWYFVYQTIYERSMRYVLERKSNYLKTMNDHLQAVDSMRSNMLRVASHEFQTPLAAIQNSLSLLQKADFGNLSPKQLQLVHLATDNNDRLEHLVTNLLDSARVQSGNWKLKTESLNFLKIAEDIVQEYKPLAEKKNIQLNASFPSELPSIKGDLNLLRIACKNIVDNAIKYTPADGLVTLTLSEANGIMSLQVKDTGIGIESDVIPQLFNQFHRSARAISASPDGYGIGLYYARLIIRKHGGDITVISKVNEGSTFTITLPIVQNDIPSNKEGEKDGNQPS